MNKKKITLIDALYINQGGGKVLLDLLIESLSKNNDIYYLLDNRISKSYPFLNKNVTYLKSSIISRHYFYLLNKNKFSNVLCFSNIPPSVNLKCMVYTFFQNVNLLNKSSNSFEIFFKRFYIKYFQRNSDKWIVQTNVVSKLINGIGVDESNIFILPFFKEVSFDRIKKNNNKIKFLYVSSGEKHKNHIRLFNSFKKYFSLNNNTELTVTVDDNYNDLCDKISYFQSINIPIINKGFISHEMIKEEYKKADFFIYPSLHESFGLGLIEACQFNLPIISSDRSYVYEIVNPNLTFDPVSENSILESMIKSIDYINLKGELKIKNKLSNIIDLITK